MLRSRIRAPIDRRKLRSLFANLQKQRSERAVIREVLVPDDRGGRGRGDKPGRGRRPPPQQQWNSVDEIPTLRSDAEVRIFDTTTTTAVTATATAGRTGRLVRRIGAALGGLVTTTSGLSDAETSLLRKLTSAMRFSPADSAAAEVLARLRQLEQHPRLVRRLTPQAWTLLWSLDAGAIPTVRSRAVGDAMVRAGLPLDTDAEVKYIGGLFWSGAREQAMNRWLRLAEREPTAEVFGLGVRLRALMQQPAEAEAVVLRMQAVLGRVAHKAWLPVVLAWNHSFEPDKAWAAYARLRECAERNGERITARQFDDLAMSFLDSHQPAMGLRVYKHMVFAGHNALDRQQTEAHRNLSAAVKAAQAESLDPAQLNALSADALRSLPARIADKYFYGGWMLNLIRMRRADLAWQLVAVVMPAQQFLPDSIHCNWVVQAFLQQGRVEKARSIAAEMIAERIRQLSAAASARRPVPAVTRTRRLQHLPRGTGVQIPPATVQTFSILVHHHARRQQMPQIVSLFDRMTECAIAANSYIMNHLLYALLRTHDMTRLALTFDNMLRASRIAPDLVSFSVMWMAMWRHYTQTHRKNHDFLTPRELFALTVQHLPPRAPPADGDGDGGDGDEEGKMLDVWHAIIKCFLLARDLEGTLVALHAGAQLWRMPVDDTVVQEVAFGVLRARPWDPKITGGRPRIGAATLVTSVDRLKALGRQIVAQRAPGGRKAPSSSPARKRVLVIAEEDGSLESLTVLLKRELGDSVLVRDDVQRARADMAVLEVPLEGLGL